jgi:putative ABC transport system substrate-binding protein
LFVFGVPLRLMAQQPSGMPRVGVLMGGTAKSGGHLVQAFLRGMTELGYQDGRNVHYEYRYGDGSNEKALQNARELVASKVDLIWAPGTANVTAARKVTMSLPIVFAIVGDAVGSGFVHSLQRPGTNASGISIMVAETSAKRIEVLSETFPHIGRIGVLHNPADSASAAQLRTVSEAVRRSGKELMVVEARESEEFSAVFARLAAWRTDALVILENSLYLNHRKTLLDLAAKHRWPTISSTRDYAEAGGVIAYGADYADNCRRSAAYVDRILKGAKPAELPVQQPTKFEFVINHKSAKSMGLTIPQALLLRADQVIE